MKSMRLDRLRLAGVTARALTIAETARERIAVDVAVALRMRIMAVRAGHRPIQIALAEQMIFLIRKGPHPTVGGKRDRFLPSVPVRREEFDWRLPDDLARGAFFLRRTTMKRLLLLPLFLAAACAPTPPPQAEPVPAPEPTEPAVVPAEPTPTVANEGTFTLMQEGTTVATEEFTRTNEQLDAALSAPGQGTLAYTAALAPDATVPRIELRVLPPGTAEGATPLQRSTAVFQGDSVFTETIEADSTRTNRVATTPGAIPYVNPSPSLMEQILRRARVMGGEQVQVPVFVAGTGGQTVAAMVMFMPPDSATVTLGNTEVRLRVDDEGRLLGGRVPAQNLLIERQASRSP